MQTRGKMQTGDYRQCKILLEILPRFSVSFWLPRFWDLGENLNKILRSRWDYQWVFGRRDFEISPRSWWESRRDFEIFEFLAAKNSPRFSARSSGDLGQNFAGERYLKKDPGWQFHVFHTPCINSVGNLFWFKCSIIAAEWALRASSNINRI